MSDKPINRRQFLALTSVTALVVAGACASPQKGSSTPAGQKVRFMRIAHMTDFHVLPGEYATQGMRRTLRHVHIQLDRPDIIFNTGDSIMDSLEADKSSTESQWETFNNILSAECELPIIHAIGNHDVWGWGRQDPDL